MAWGFRGVIWGFRGVTWGLMKMTLILRMVFYTSER